MVRVGEMLKKKNSLRIQTNEDEARGMFRSHATFHEEGKAVPLQVVKPTFNP